MRNHIKEYKDHLEKAIGEYMERPASERSAEAIDGMSACWMRLNDVEKMLTNCARYSADFTRDDAMHWNEKMINDDGTMGGHWTIEQTTAVAESMGVKFEHISEYCWNTAMNMMYSDYCGVAEKFGVGTPEFYACMAKAFLFDKDGGSPKEKMAAYYHGIVSKE